MRLHFSGCYGNDTFHYMSHRQQWDKQWVALFSQPDVVMSLWKRGRSSQYMAMFCCGFHPKWCLCLLLEKLDHLNRPHIVFLLHCPNNISFYQVGWEVEVMVTLKSHATVNFQGLHQAAAIRAGQFLNHESQVQGLQWPGPYESIGSLNRVSGLTRNSADSDDGRQHWLKLLKWNESL